MTFMTSFVSRTACAQNVRGRAEDRFLSVDLFAARVAALFGFGLKPEELTTMQVSLRGVVVFLVALVLVRLSDRRSLTKKSPFAVVLLVVIASVLARAINGSGAFVPTLAAATVIVLLHRLLAVMVHAWPAFSHFVKGRSVLLVKEGKLQARAMRKTSVAEADILEDLRLTVKKDNLDEIESARLEVSGNVSFVMKKDSE